MYVIGTIYKPTGVILTDSEGMKYPETAPIAGFHVNSPYQIAEFAEYEVEEPTSPQAIYSGAKTYFYTFSDKETFEAFDVDSLTFIMPKVVPKMVTARQARLALLSHGLLDQVESTISSLPEGQAAAIEWQYGNDVERDSLLVAVLGQALGLDGDALDDLFIEGAKL